MVTWLPGYLSSPPTDNVMLFPPEDNVMPFPPENNIQWLPGYLVTCLPHPRIMLCFPHPRIMLCIQWLLTKCYQVTGGYSTCCRRLSLYLFSLPSLTKCYQVTELPRNRTLIKSSLSLYQATTGIIEPSNGIHGRGARL